MTDVFISYSRKDTQFVRRLHDALQNEGRDVWIDWENIPLTADWLEEIKAGIEATGAFLYIISPDSVHSDVVAVELAHAIENSKRIVPILYRDLIEEYDKAALHPTISSHNWLFFREEDNFEKAYAGLQQALDVDLRHQRMHTRLLIKAKEWADRNRDAANLLRGNELHEAEVWLQSATGKKPPPADLHYEYIMSSNNLSNTRQRRQLLGAVAIAVFGFLLAGFSFAQYWNAQRAEQEARAAEQIALAAEEDALQAEQVARNEADRVRSLAVASIAQQLNDRVLAVALAQEASEFPTTPPQVDRALADVVYAPGVRKPLTLTDIPQGAEVHAAAYSLDGTRVAVGYDEGIVGVWDADTGDMVNMLRVESSGAGILELHMLANSRLIAAADSSGMITVWELDTGDISASYGPYEGLNDFDLAPDDSEFMIGLDGGVAQVISLETGDVLKTFELTAADGAIFNGDVTAVAYADDESQMAFGTSEGQLVLYSRINEVVFVDRSLHSGPIWELVYEPGESGLLFTASDDETALKISTRAGDIIEEYIGHTNAYRDIDVSADGSTLITASEDRTLIVWDADTGNELDRLWAHDNWVMSVAFNPSGLRAVSASRDGIAFLWDLQPGNIVRVMSGHRGWIRTVDIAPNDEIGASGSDDDSVRVWDLQTGRPLATFNGHTADVRGVRFTADSRQVVSAALDGTVCVWRWESEDTPEDARCHMLMETGVALQSLDVNAAGTLALTGTADGLVILWEVATGEVVRVMDEHSLADTADVGVLDVRFSPDGTQALSASQDSTAIHWDLETGEILHILAGHGREALSVAFSPDGTRAVTGSRDAEVFEWDLTAETTTLAGVKLPQEHGSSVRGMAFSPRGNFVLSASADLTMLLWDLDDDAAIREFSGHARTIYSVDFTSDGRVALSGSRDMTLILWRVDNAVELNNWLDAHRYQRTLTDEECELYELNCDAGHQQEAQPPLTASNRPQQPDAPQDD